LNIFVTSNKDAKIGDFGAALRVKDSGEVEGSADDPDQLF
jgi:hypothetical protein